VPDVAPLQLNPSSGGSGYGDLFQQRLRVLGALGGGLSLLFAAVVFGLSGQAALPQVAGVGLVAAAYAVGGLLARGRPRTLTFLRRLDELVTVAAIVGCALHAHVGPDAVDYRWDGVLAANNVLIVRAILLPSPPRRTAVLGAIALLPLVLPALVLPSPTPLLFAAWAFVAVAVSTVVSRVIYDLRQEARRARHLGQYQLEERIGVGGMGEVYRARHAMLRRPTAIKLLRPDRAGAEAIERFEQEVQSTALLSHPNTVAIYDYGRTADRVFYYAMEFLDGRDLQRVVESAGPLPPARVAHILKQVCGSLAEAHAAGLVHRDVKAANVLLCRRGGRHDVVKVVDFGLVLPAGTASSDDDGARIIGTPTYLSPEGYAGSDSVDARSDLYAVGVLAYYLLAGRLPFPGPTLAALCSQHLFTVPDRLDVEPGLAALVAQCLEKEPDARPPSADAIAARLDALDLGDWTETHAAAWWSRLEAPAAERGEPLDETLDLALDSRIP